jgi:dienelactone hydrolase
MTEILLFHHAHGLTQGVLAFADVLRSVGYIVHTPDLYDGQTFEELADGVAYAESTGFEAIIERGLAAAERLPSNVVYVGFSLGVLPAQKLAQTRPGAIGAVLISSCAPPEMLGPSWPNALPVQIHGMDADPYFAGEGDIDVARQLVANVERGELFVYPGHEHLFADNSLPSYHPASAELLVQRVLGFLNAVARRG